MAFLQGKRILITGLLSNRSIAYGIAQACHREGAELAFTYVGERFKQRITEFAAERGIKTMVENHGFFCQDSVRVEKLVSGVAHSRITVTAP